MWKDMSVAGYARMKSDMARYGWTHSYSSLHPILNGANPDDCVSSIPYEKGYRFLYFLESLLEVENYKLMFRAYIDKFKEKSIVTGQFRAHFEEWTKAKMGAKADDIIKAVDWDLWVEKPGVNEHMEKQSFVTDE